MAEQQLDAVEVANMLPVDLAEAVGYPVWSHLENGNELVCLRGGNGAERVRGVRGRLDFREVPPDCVLDTALARGWMIASRQFEGRVTLYRITPAGRVAVGKARRAGRSC